jgi:hypothetical protein
MPLALSVLFLIPTGVSAFHAISDTKIDRLDQIRPAITRCWSPSLDFEGLTVTLRFSLTRSGELLGKPRITYSKLSGDQDRDLTFIVSVLSAVERCLPLPLTDDLGAGIAGRPLTITFLIARNT